MLKAVSAEIMASVFMLLSIHEATNSLASTLANSPNIEKPTLRFS